MKVIFSGSGGKIRMEILNIVQNLQMKQAEKNEI